MVALHITDVKLFMQLLLAGEAFDKFSFVEGDICTSITYHLDGHSNYSFYTEEELEELKIEEFQNWAVTKGIVTKLISGKKLPVSMKLVLKKQGKEDVTYLLNIRFDGGNLILVTGISRPTFSTDRSAEQEWDANAQGFLKKNQIVFEVME